MDKAGNDNKSNQMNPNSQTYSSSRGGGSIPSTTAGMDKPSVDNRSNQMNPNHQASKGGK